MTGINVPLLKTIVKPNIGVSEKVTNKTYELLLHKTQNIKYIR